MTDEFKTAYIEAQKNVIGAFLLDDTIDPNILQKQDFSKPYSEIFEVIQQLIFENVPADVVTITDRLGKQYANILADCACSITTSSSVKHHAEIVRNTAKKHIAYKKATKLLRLLETESVEDCQEFAGDIIKTLDTSKTGDTFSAAEVYDRFIKNLDNKPEYIKTGLPKVDSLVFIQPGDYVVVGGRPSSGKTALTIQIMLNIAFSGKRVVYFSLETNVDKIGERIVSNLGKADMSKIKKRELKDDWEAISYRIINLPTVPFHVVEASGWSVQQIKAKAVELEAEVIFVDHLGLLKGQGKSLYERVTGISNDLHIMAQQNKIAVFVLSQLNRKEGAPDMTSLRESGAIEQDADLIFLLTEPKNRTDEGYDETDRNLIICKNKDGKTGILEFKFKGEIQRFYEVQQGDILP